MPSLRVLNDIRLLLCLVIVTAYGLSHCTTMGVWYVPPEGRRAYSFDCTAGRVSFESSEYFDFLNEPNLGSKDPNYWRRWMWGSGWFTGRSFADHEDSALTRFTLSYGKRPSFQAIVRKGNDKGAAATFPANFVSIPLWPLALPAAIIAIRRLSNSRPLKSRRGFTPILETRL